MSQLPLVASAISSLINSPVKTYDECVNNGLTINPSQILDLDVIYKRSLTRIEFDGPAPTNIISSSGIEIQIFVRPISGGTQSMMVNPNITVLEFKQAVHAKLGTGIEEMRLMFAGKQLDDQKTLTSYDIQKECTITIIPRIMGGHDFSVIKDDLLDPSYDYDFTNINDNGAKFVRGRESYKRPCGWKRIAFNVGKYGNDDKWLGSVGDSLHEWPVSYHGTKKEFAESIATEGYLLSKGVNFAYGIGIYSSPEISVAEGYAATFNYNNVEYKVVLQNRVNPAGLEKHVNDTYWVTPKDEDIRPYGLCIKPT